MISVFLKRKRKNNCKRSIRNAYLVVPISMLKGPAVRKGNRKSNIRRNFILLERLINHSTSNKINYASPLFNHTINGYL